MSFPPDGPATLGGTKTELVIPDDDHTEDDLIVQRVNAVNSIVLSWPVASVADTDPPAADWNGAQLQHIVVGANMLAARLHRRRGSSDGTAVLGSELLGVALGDPDVALLLQVGNGAKPAVG